MRVAKKTILDKIQEFPPGTNPNTEEVTELFLKLHELGYKIENSGKCLFAKQEEYVVMYSRTSDLLQCYYLGYGHDAVKCSLQSFRDTDHIILWQEELKSMTLTESPELLMYEETPTPTVTKPKLETTKSYLQEKKMDLFLEYYNRGFTDGDIRQATGLSQRTIQKYRTILNLPMHKRRKYGWEPGLSY